MRTKLLASSLLIAFILTGSVFSQPKPPSVKEKLQQLKKTLELSETQAKQIEVILKTTESKMDSLKEKMEDAHDDAMDAMDAMDNIIESEDKEIVKVLDESQKEKYVEMKKEMEENRPQKGERPEPPGEKN